MSLKNGRSDVHHTWNILSSEDAFDGWLRVCGSGPFALDIETYGKRPNSPNGRLLGISITKLVSEGHYDSVYIPLVTYDFEIKQFKEEVVWLGALRMFLDSREFIGWNVAFDKSWLDYKFKIDTKWIADGRIMWHLQNNNEKIRGYGLKLAQKELLGWEETNEQALKQHVASRGGRLSNGDHYMADTDVLAYYACLDTYSTYLAYQELKVFFDKHQYWDFLKSSQDFSWFLRQCTLDGIKLDVSELSEAAVAYKTKREQFASQLRADFIEEIEALEYKWLQKSLKRYKTLRGKAAYMNNKKKHKRFNPGSSDQRIELLHDVLKLPVLERTEGGQPKTDRGTLAMLDHPAAKLLLQYSEYKKLYEMAGTYIENSDAGRLYPSYDVCGTVSGRLAGFEPSVLNLPFSEELLMSPFKCEPGYTGIHADLASIEPCVIAHYSEDEALLKVYRDGLGDIYLDLALELFPEDKDLVFAYNSHAKLDSSLKERFKDLRAIAKTIHLAVSYTGSYITVGKNLNKSGFPTDEERARLLVRRYWKKFHAVANFNHKLKYVYDKQKYVRNIVGRVIQVPEIFKKDLMNRLIQSSAHDILMLWVKNIQKSVEYYEVDMRPILPDVHDSTSWQVKEGQEQQAKEVFQRALRETELEINLAVPLKAEIKYFKTFAGLKGDE